MICLHTWSFDSTPTTLSIDLWYWNSALLWPSLVQWGLPIKEGRVPEPAKNESFDRCVVWGSLNLTIMTLTAFIVSWWLWMRPPTKTRVQKTSSSMCALTYLVLSWSTHQQQPSRNSAAIIVLTYIWFPPTTTHTFPLRLLLFIDNILLVR